MESEEARKVLGLQPEEDWTAHIPAFQAARQKMADLVRQAPTEALAIRYQDGLMEFDRALAFFRAEDEAKHRAEREQAMAVSNEEPEEDSPVLTVPEVATVTPEAISTEVESTSPSSRSRWIALLFLAIVAAGAYLGYQEHQKRLADEKQMTLARWESEAADHVSKRRWQEALDLYTKIETTTPNSAVALRGRRSIEAGMREEHEQYIGYWTGEALSAFEAKHWADTEAAIEKVLAYQPHHPEMRELSAKLILLKSEGERQRLAQEAQVAIDQGNWQVALQHADQWLSIEPQAEVALALKKQASEGLKQAEKNTKRAQEIIAKAKSLDKGEYNKALHDLVAEAKRLAPHDAEASALYEKIASYARTLRVPSEFADLQKALAEAKDLDRVVIEKGSYPGPFQINSAVIVESRGGQVILECPSEKGPALSFGPAAQGARIQGLRLQHTDFSTATERFSAALVDAAAVQFFECEFHRAAGHGLVLVHGAQVTAERCRFIENGWNGVTAQDPKSELTLRDSLCQGNFQHGIEIWQDASATLEKNRSIENSQNGIHVATSAKISLKNNQFSSNREYGLVIHRASAGEISLNTCISNLLGGIVIAAPARDVSVRNNVVQRNDGPCLMLGKGLDSAPYQQNQLQPKSGQKSILTDVPME